MEQVLELLKSMLEEMNASHKKMMARMEAGNKAWREKIRAETGSSEQKRKP
jgi:hypothetical protein